MNLNDVPADEARALLERQYFCEEYGEWAPAKASPESFRLICGLLNAEGSRTNLYVELYVKVSQKTKIAHYKFSVLRRRPMDGRVYQLEVRTAPKALRHRHQWPHEHIGSHKCPGDVAWADWGFEDVLARFMLRTRIVFRPPLESPMTFRLRPT